MRKKTQADELVATRLRGGATYAADAALDNPLHLSFLRSPVACGEIRVVDATAVDAFAVHTGQDVKHIPPLSVNEVIDLARPLPFPILVQTEVLAVGQPVAAVLGETQCAAADAAERILIEIDEGDFTPQRVAQKTYTAGDAQAAFAQAAHIVSCRIEHSRLAPSPMEPRGIAVAYENGAVTIHQSTQTPHRTRSELARMLGVDANRINVIATDVGGAFGMKGSLYPEEVFAVWAAFHHQRSVRWIATRSEDFLSATHGRGIVSVGRLALDKNGHIAALEARFEAPIGGWLPNSGLIPAWNAARILPSGYDVQTVDIETSAHITPRAPMGIYRGAGRPEANLLMERLMDKAAKALGQDPVEFRRHNLVPRLATPHETPTGQKLDSGDYRALLDHLKSVTNYEALRKDIAARQHSGEFVGLGVAFYVEPSGAGHESARVTWFPDGKAHVASGSSSQGQAREETLAVIASCTLSIPPSAVTVICGDTRTCPEGIGALASRSTAIGGSAVLEACKALKQRRDNGETGEIAEGIRYENDGQAWGYGAYLCVAAIDAETGSITIEKAICVDDAGRLILPDIVNDQITGGFAQGFGEAMLESVRYDLDHQLLTGSFMDYAMPRASDVPKLKIHKCETPSPLNALGAKGVGEAGTIGAPPAILSAVLDALTPLGISDLDMPLTPCKVWTAINAARKERR